MSAALTAPLSDWWWTVDRPMVSLVVCSDHSCVISFAASPPVAERLGLDGLHFVLRHALYCSARIGAD